MSEYYPCGDGTCQFVHRCANVRSEKCYICMYNTGATPRDYFEPNSQRDKLTEEELDMIES